MSADKIERLAAVRDDLGRAADEVGRRIQAMNERLRPVAPSVRVFIATRDGAGYIGWSKANGHTGGWGLAYAPAFEDDDGEPDPKDTIAAEKAPLRSRIELLDRIEEVIEILLARAEELAEQARRAGS